MADKLEEILLRLGLDASGFTKGARQAKTELGTLEKGVGSLKGELSALAAQAAAGVGFAVLISQAMEFAEAVTVVAERTGMSVESVQFLRLAADQTGVSVDSLAGTVNKLQRQMVEAASDDKLRAKLEQLVGPLEQLRLLAPEDQLQKVAEAIAAVSDPAERTATAVTLLGKSGAEAIPEMVALADHQQELNEAFARTGGAVSADAIAAVEGLGDAVGVAKTSVVSLATELLATVAPAFTSFLQTVTEVVGGLRLLDGQGDDALVNLDNKIAAAVNTLEVLKASAYSAYGGMNSMARDAIAAQEALVAKLREEYDARAGLGVAGGQRLAQEMAINAQMRTLGEQHNAEMLGLLFSDAAIRANFADLQFEEVAAEMDRETQMRIDALRARHELERLEEEAQASWLKEQMAEVNEHVLEGIASTSDLKITTAQQDLTSTLGMLTQESAGVARHSKEMFELNKALALANAVATLPSAVLKSYDNAGGYPWGIVPAGIMAAIGAAQISAIASSKFGSKTAPSQAAQPVTPTADVGGQGGGGGGGGPSRVMRVEGVSAESLMTGSMVRTLAGQIADFVKDGGKVEWSS